MRPDLDDIIHRHPPGQPLLLTTVNTLYMPLFDRWWAGVERFDNLRVLVGALDDATVPLLRDRGVPSVRLEVEHPTDFSGQLWIERLGLIAELLEAGITVLNSDIDAFWIRDPRPYLAACDSDLTIQIEYGVPGDVRDDWGFVMCCGFFCCWPTPAVLRLLPDWLAYCERDRHDQIGLNRLFRDAGVDWQDDSTQGNRGFVPRYGLSIDVIERRLASREPYPNALVYHPFLQPKPMWRKIRLAAEGLRKIGGHPLPLGDRLGSYLPVEHFVSKYRMRKFIKHTVMRKKRPTRNPRLLEPAARADAEN